MQTLLEHHQHRMTVLATALSLYDAKNWHSFRLFFIEHAKVLYPEIIIASIPGTESAKVIKVAGLDDYVVSIDTESLAVTLTLTISFTDGWKSTPQVPAVLEIKAEDFRSHIANRLTAEQGICDSIKTTLAEALAEDGGNT